MTLTLNYEDEGMDAKVQAFDQELSLAPRSNISAVPEVPFDLTMLLGGLLKDKSSNWRISTLNHDFLVVCPAQAQANLLGLSHLSTGIHHGGHSE